MEELNLRPLQERFMFEVHAALRANRKVCAVAPTGFGKAVVATCWAGKIAERLKRLLVVTNRRILVEQIGSQCTKYGVPFGIVMGNELRNDSALVQVASLQTLKIRKWKDMPDADWVIVDECHNEPAAAKVLFDIHSRAKCLGLTATPVGPAGTTLQGLYDVIVEPVRNDELIKDKWLLPTTCLCPSEPDTEGVWIDRDGKQRKGVDVSGGKEFNQEQLSQIVENCTVFGDVFRWWEQYSHMQTLVFVPRVKFAHGVAQQFVDRGVTAKVIEGGTRASERKETFKEFSETDARVLVAVDVLREGFDSPIAQCGIDLQPCHQFRTWWQKLGRVRRPHGTQETAIWLDFAGNLWRHGIHPDENPPWNDVTGDKTTADALAERCGRRCKECGSTNIRKGRCEACGAEVSKAKKPWSCPVCSYVLSPWERIADGKCPSCRTKVGQPLRRIRMRDGQMRVVGANEVKRLKKSKATDAQKCWDACRYRAMHSGKTMDFARWLYHKETGNWPSNKTLKCCPDPQSGDWKRKPADVFPRMRGPKT